MTKQKISHGEIPLILKKYNKSLWLSTLIFPFILIMIGLPIYFLFFFLMLFLTGKNYEDSMTVYIGIIIFLVLINFLYGKIIINRRIKNKDVDKINQDFKVLKKDSYTYTSENVSDSAYYRLYLSDEKNEKIGIYISKEDYLNIVEGQSLNLTYYELLDIPIEGFYENKKLDFFKFFIIQKWKRIKKLISV
ncbi:DUF2500 family protein [Chryseobacterium gregarium]|uniref:DUF2500 family protein n=1 Tax=Chryseobacterium gregarium TaxID=456299 RepID=UPI0003FBB091|nr:DUF2500 family protein [Chryseobacterium gregarium]